MNFRHKSFYNKIRSTNAAHRSSVLILYTIKTFRVKVFGATFFQKGSEKILSQTNYSININVERLESLFALDFCVAVLNEAHSNE